MGSYTAYRVGNLIAIPLYVVFYLLALAFTFWRGIPYALQTWLIIGLFYVIGVFETLNTGRTGDGRILLLAFALIAALFYGRRAGLVAIGLNVLTLFAFGMAFSNGWLRVFSLERQAVSIDFFPWVSNAGVQTMVGVLLILGYDFLLTRFSQNIANGQGLIGELQMQTQLLKSREFELAQRNMQLQAAAQIARETTAISNEELLLTRSADLIVERFGYAYVGLYVLGSNGEHSNIERATLRAVAGDPQLQVTGEEMFSEASLVGRAIRQMTVQTDNSEDADVVLAGERGAAAQSDLYAGIALPMVIQSHVIGALEARVAGRRAFSADEIEALQTLVDQIAVALSNARLLTQVQANLDAVRQTVGETSSRAWQEFLIAQTGLAERYDPDRLLPPVDQWLPELDLAIQKRTPLINQDETSAQLVVPIQVRGQAIGAIDARKLTGGEWTSTEIETMQTLVDQLGVALESARLYQDTQRRALREQLSAQVTARMRESLDMETVLKTAASEMREALGLEGVIVQLTPPDTTRNQGKADKHRPTV